MGGRHQTAPPAPHESSQWRIAVAILAVGLVGAFAPAASAAEVDVVSDTNSVTLHSEGAGEQSAEVMLANLTTSLVHVQRHPIILGAGRCALTVNPDILPPGRWTTVTIDLSGCTVTKDGADINLGFVGRVRPQSYLIHAALPAPIPRPHWYIVGWSAVAAAVAGFCLVAVMLGLMYWPSRRRRGLGWSTELLGLGTDWSFKDNWISNVTVGSGVLVVLLAGSDILTGVVGAEPKAAITLLAVAGALSAVLVGISPLFVKLIGADVSAATVGGSLIAAFVTILGSVGQITVMTWQGWELATGAVRFVVAVLGALVGGVALAYAGRALWYYIDTGSKKPPEKRSDALKAADLIVVALTGNNEEKQQALESALAARAAPEAAPTTEALNPYL